MRGACSAGAERKKGQTRPLVERSGIHLTIEPGSPSACGLVIEQFLREVAHSQILQLPLLALGAQACALALNLEPHQRNCFHFPISSLWGARPSQCAGPMGGSPKKFFTLLDLCVSSLRRGHANLLCIVPILTDDPRRESTRIDFRYHASKRK